MKTFIFIFLVLITSCKVLEDTTVKTKTDVADKSTNVTDTTKTVVGTVKIEVDTTKTSSGETTTIKNTFVVGKDSAGNDIPILKSQEINTTKTTINKNGLYSIEKKDSSNVQGKDSTNMDLKIDDKTKIEKHKEVSTDFGWWTYILGAISAVLVFGVLKKYLSLIKIFLGIK